MTTKEIAIKYIEQAKADLHATLTTLVTCNEDGSLSSDIEWIRTRLADIHSDQESLKSLPEGNPVRYELYCDSRQICACDEIRFAIELACQYSQNQMCDVDILSSQYGHILYTYNKGICVYIDSDVTQAIDNYFSQMQ